MIIDATDLILGRLAAYAAKQTLLGEPIFIVNCGKAVVTGSRASIIKHYKHKFERGTHSSGPFIPTVPDRFVKRTIRGMLPHRQEKGRNALERIKCYNGVPSDTKDKKIETLASANIADASTLKFVTVDDICRELRQR